MTFNAIFSGFFMAFDRVVHKNLCYKLSLCGIRGPILGRFLQDDLYWERILI